LAVWDPSRFAGAAHFTAEADKLINSVRESPLKPGVERIRLPGDRSAAVRAQCLAEGISVAEAVWEQLSRVAGKLRVAVPEGNAER